MAMQTQTEVPTGSDATDRVATAGEGAVRDAVVLINRFRVPEGRDQEFRNLWDRTSAYFRGRPGFVSLRLHRAVGPDVAERWVNVATWASEAEFKAAHATEEFRGLVSQPAWREFPSSPGLYEVVVAAG